MNASNLMVAPIRPQDEIHAGINQYNEGDFIQLQKVNKAYGELAVMDNFDLTMRDDDRLVIIGPSGSGKSSLLRVLMGLEGIQSGAINFQKQHYIIGGEGKKARILDTGIQKKIGMVFQHYTLFPHLSILHNLILAPVKVHRIPKAQATEQARALLARFGLESKLNAYPSQLSGGPETAGGHCACADAGTQTDVV